MHQDKAIDLYGPAPFPEQLQHRLSAYTWSLLPQYTTNLILVVTEVSRGGRGRTTTFHSHSAFVRQADDIVDLPRSVLLEENTLRVSTGINGVLLK